MRLTLCSCNNIVVDSASCDDCKENLFEEKEAYHFDFGHCPIKIISIDHDTAVATIRNVQESLFSPIPFVRIYGKGSS